MFLNLSIMSEIVCVQVGQCGNQIGSSLWPQILRDHGLQDPNLFNDRWSDSMNTFFYMKESTVKARALLIDMEDSVVGRFQTGALKELFDKTCSLTSYPGSGNNWGVGFYDHGNEQREAIEEMVQAMIENSDRLHAFLPMFSLAGGTGSGLGSAIVTILDEMYPKIDRIVVCVHPGNQYDVITTPYNVAFSVKTIVEHATCAFPVDNEALLNICNHHGMGLTENWRPYRNMNSVISKMILQLTSGARFPGPLSLEIRDLSTNLVPFPSLNLLTSSLSPIIFGKNKTTRNLRSASDLVNDVWLKKNQLLRVNPLNGTVMSACLQARGQCSLTSILQALVRLEKDGRSGLWSGAVSKIGMTPVQSRDHPFSLLALTNSTAMRTFFSQTLAHFDALYKRKAHVHHYRQVVGFPYNEFEATRDAFLNIINDYSIACDTKEDDPFSTL